MPRHLIGPDEVKTFEDVEREVAQNPNSQPIDRAIAAVGDKLLGVLEQQFFTGPKTAFSGPKIELPGRYAVVSFDEAPLDSETERDGVEALIERAIGRLFGKTRVSDLTEAAGRGGGGKLYALHYAGKFEGLGKLHHGVQIEAIDAFTPSDESMEHNYFQRSMMDMFSNNLDPFMGRGDKPSHVRWELVGETGPRGRIPIIDPVPLFSRDRLSIVRVKCAGLEEIRPLEDICREIALKLDEVTRVRDVKEPWRPRKRAS